MQIRGYFREDTKVLLYILEIPIVIGNIPFGETSSATIIHTRMSHIPTAPIISTDDNWPLEPILMEPSAPVFPDDDTVSIRTYASTPSPFADDGSFRISYTKFY